MCVSKFPRAHSNKSEVSFQAVSHAIMWVLETKLRFSGLASSAGTHWAILLALNMHY